MAAEKFTLVCRAERSELCTINRLPADCYSNECKWRSFKNQPLDEPYACVSKNSAEFKPNNDGMMSSISTAVGLQLDEEQLHKPLKQGTAQNKNSPQNGCLIPASTNYTTMVVVGYAVWGLLCCINAVHENVCLHYSNYC